MAGSQKPAPETPAEATSYTLDHASLLRLVGYHLHCADALFTQHFRRRVTSDHELTTGEFAVLCLLDSNANVNPKLLSAELGIAAPNLAVMLNSLQSRGLIVRKPNELDRRSMHLELTRGGRTSLRKILALVESHEAQLLARLTAAQRATLLDLLTLIHGIGLPR